MITSEVDNFKKALPGFIMTLLAGASAVLGWITCWGMARAGYPEPLAILTGILWFMLMIVPFIMGFESICKARGW